MQIITESLSKNCNLVQTECRDITAALLLKLVAIISILICGTIGIAIPLVGRHRRFLRTDSSLFPVAKSFAAGVILATGFVHILPDGSVAFSAPCLSETIWSKFPFSGFFAMMAALATLFLEFVGTQYYERKHKLIIIEPELEAEVSGLGIESLSNFSEKLFGEEEDGIMPILGMHAHSAHHSHSHSHPHGHQLGFGDGDMGVSGVRHVIVSQILELGVVSHSIIIGLSLGVSQSPCTIRPLIVALSFHQFFEGFALGGCIAQAQLKTKKAILMACIFSITTPVSIGVGAAVSTTYNPYNVGALVAEGILDSLSAGILVYIALVDLIAADFLSKKMRCNFRLQLVSYLMLFLGAASMSSLAIWS